MSNAYRIAAIAILAIVAIFCAGLAACLVYQGFAMGRIPEGITTGAAFFVGAVMATLNAESILVNR